MELNMEIVYSLLYSYTFVCATVSWFFAQAIKLALVRFFEKRWEHLFEAGGMPSSHSASVTALMISVGLSVGWGSPLFAAVFVLAIIVMYDATGVRRSVGEQAEILIKLIENTNLPNNIKIKKPKEVSGHYPIEVIAGAALGVLTTLILYYVYYIR